MNLYVQQYKGHHRWSKWEIKQSKCNHVQFWRIHLISFFFVPCWNVCIRGSIIIGGLFVQCTCALTHENAKFSILQWISRKRIYDSFHTVGTHVFSFLSIEKTSMKYTNCNVWVKQTTQTFDFNSIIPQNRSDNLK